MKRFGCLAVAVAAVVFLGAGPAGAQATPSAAVSPASGLVDGQAVSVTSTGFLAVSSSGGTFVPTAFECAPQFPPSALYTLETVSGIVGPLLNQYCTGLGQFPVTQSNVTSLVVNVRRAFTSPDGNAIACGAAPGDCLIVVTGVQPPLAGLASAPISFAARPPTKDDCRHGGWRLLVDAHGKHFRNQGQCVRSVEARRRPHRRHHAPNDCGAALVRAAGSCR
jgi:hypothetical protein